MSKNKKSKITQDEESDETAFTNELNEFSFKNFLEVNKNPNLQAAESILNKEDEFSSIIDDLDLLNKPLKTKKNQKPAKNSANPFSFKHFIKTESPLPPPPPPLTLIQDDNFIPSPPIDTYTSKLTTKLPDFVNESLPRSNPDPKKDIQNDFLQCLYFE